MGFFDRLKGLCDDSGIPVTQIGNIVPGLNCSVSTVSQWKNGAIPRVSRVKPIADYFGVTVDWLMNGDNSNSSNTTINGNGNVVGNGNTIITLSMQERALLDLFQSLDIVGQAKVLTFAAELQQKKTGNNPDQM